jgi:membrane dipeptidase
VGAQFWSAYIPVQVTGTEAIEAILEQIDIIHNFCNAYPDVFEMAYTSADITRLHARGKVACLIGVEGGHAISDSPAVLRDLYRLGARYMTLTHWKNTDWADAATAPPQHAGLTDFGRQIVMEMNRLGMLVDLSHVSPETMKDVLEITKAPVIFSHSSVRSFSNFPRNVPDEILKRIPQNGGVVMINFAPAFISEKALQYGAVKAGEEKRLKSLYPEDPEKVKRELKSWQEKNPDPGATLQEVADHIDAVRRIAGINHVGLGSDFDGINTTPSGLEDVSRFPALLVELLKRGYAKEEIEKVAGLNLLRVLKQCEKTSEELRKELSPLQLELPKLKTSED